MASATAIASTVGTISAATGDQVIAVIQPILIGGIQINPDGGRLVMQRPDGSTYTGVAIELASVTGASTMTTFIKIPG